MATYTERSRTRRLGHWIAAAAGVIVFLIGLYFIFGISAATDRKNAECTEELPGTVTECTASGSGYLTSIEYTPGYEPVVITMNTDKEYSVGTELTVRYEPMSFRHVYIEGLSTTGAKDRKTGLIMLLAGAVLAVLGFLAGKWKRA